jgi:hypothetical protein
VDDHRTGGGVSRSQRPWRRTDDLGVMSLSSRRDRRTDPAHAGGIMLASAGGDASTRHTCARRPGS